MKPDQQDSKDVLQLLQQKIGNLELTVHAMMQVLEEKDSLTQEEITQQAQEIVEEMQAEVGKEQLDLDT